MLTSQIKYGGVVEREPYRTLGIRPPQRPWARTAHRNAPTTKKQIATAIVRRMVSTQAATKTSWKSWWSWWSWCASWGQRGASWLGRKDGVEDRQCLRREHAAVAPVEHAGGDRIRPDRVYL
jgi:hypothetical protein